MAEVQPLHLWQWKLKHCFTGRTLPLLLHFLPQRISALDTLILQQCVGSICSEQVRTPQKKQVTQFTVMGQPLLSSLWQRDVLVQSWLLTVVLTEAY